MTLQLIAGNMEGLCHEILSIVFNSDTYQKVMDERTRLYYQSSGYVFAFLDEELKNGKLG